MPTPLDKLFRSDFEVGTHAWNVEVFRRAYLYPGSPFERVLYRIRAGFSVLVYLPGNCMRAAAEVLRGHVKNVAWKEHGLAEGNTRTMAQIWVASAGLLEALANWIRGVDPTRPYAIFHNLDMLADSRGGLDMSNEAKTAVFYLTECSRSGVVLGLSDLSAGDLPEVVSRPFSEKVWLEEIPAERFPFLVPRALGDRLAAGPSLPDGPAHLLASRLRWTDPCRAVRIMTSVSGASDIGDALTQVTAHTRSVEFSDPASLRFDLPGEKTTLPGYEEETVRALETGFVEPFQRWAAYVGDASEQQLRRLPPGFILHGPPGTGKSRLARWVASRIRVPFRQVGAADLKRANWGETERLVRELFRSARRAAPCMIVLDDADDLLPKRETLTGGLAGAERGVVNAFLQELEGFLGKMDGVLVVLTTNRFHHLDEAARSRLTRNYLIPFPVCRAQVRDIVLELGRHYGIEPTAWPGEVLDRLEDFFFRPLRPVREKVELPDVRRRVNEGLFSPREISAALQMMMTRDGSIPGLRDVADMERYYKRQAELERVKETHSGPDQQARREGG